MGTKDIFLLYNFVIQSTFNCCFVKTIRNLRINPHLSLLMITPGIILLAYMILIEDEPGAIPLLMAIIGICWYIVTKRK